MYDVRQFVIFSTSELDKIDFNEVLETSADTVKKSVDGTKTFIKWDDRGTVPPSIQTLTTIQDFYTYEEMLDILNTLEWSAPMEVM